jgi:hypothetical protein
MNIKIKETAQKLVADYGDMAICELPKWEFDPGVGRIARLLREAGYDEAPKAVIPAFGWGTAVVEFVEAVMATEEEE